jgi:quinol monooxygenase YgiN
MGRTVIVGYKPKPGKEAALKELMKTHLPRLKEQGLVRNKASYIMEASDGTIVEVFEWLSDEAIQKAHNDPEVQKMWGEYTEVCDYTPLGSLAEAGNLFASFTALD